MLNTIGLWTILACSFFILICMFLYAYGVFAKWSKHCSSKKKKQLNNKTRKTLRKKGANALEKATVCDNESITELQKAIEEIKLPNSKKEEMKKQDAEEDNESRKMTFVTGFHKCLFAIFFAGVVLFFPYYWDYFQEDVSVVRILKMFLMSLHNTARLFILDGDFEPIQHVARNATAIGKEGWLTAAKCVYGLYATALYLIAPFMTAGFVLSLFKGITAYFKYQHLSKADEVYLISELNDRSIELAKDIVSQKGTKKKRIIVFAEVFAKDEEKSFELISQAKNLGAYCFKRDVADLGLKRGRINKSTVQNVYFISENEDENVEQALIMIEDCRKKEKFNTANTHFYVFATTAESEALLDFVDNGNMKLRRVNENKDLAISTLCENDVFSHAVARRYKHPKKQGTATIFDREDLKVLRVLIIGLGNYGAELLKTLCWSCQTFSYIVEIYVFDKSGDARANLSRIAPDLLRYSEEGDGLTRPYYKIDFTENIDVNAGAFYETLDEKIPGAVTTVFVTLGEDELNIQTAMGLRSYFGRKVQKHAEQKEEFEKLNIEEGADIEWQERIPQIFSTVYSGIKNRIFARNGGLKNVEGENYDITFIGDMTKRYSLTSIERAEWVKSGKEIHLRYSDLEEKNQLAKRIETMQNLVLSNDLETVSGYLQVRAGELQEQAAALTKGIRRQAEKLLRGADTEKIALWEKQIEQDETTAIQAEMENLAAETEKLKVQGLITPQGVIKDLRRKDCDKLIKTINKKKNLIVVCNLFNEVLSKETNEGKLTAYKNFLQQLIQLANDYFQKLEISVQDAIQKYDRYEYYRSSSIATAIHEELLARLYTDEDYEKLLLEREEYQSATESERLKMRKTLIETLKGDLEHLRWQAYMWAEGYQKGLRKSSIDKTNASLVATDQRTTDEVAISMKLVGTDKTKEN